VLVEPETIKALERFVPLAPLHQPHNLAPMARLLERSRELPQVACFDTSFHRTIPDVAQRFALPAELHDAGIQRYGFHGLSYEYIASELPRLDAKAAAARTIVLHLGNGASMCAIEAGRSVATTMGFTPADGLAMGTRCGALDPGVILYLMDERKLDPRAIEKLLYHDSGLLGVSGISSDMRTLLSSSQPSARSRSTSSCTGSGGSSAHWPPRLAASTRSSSQAGSASTRRRFASASAATRRGSESSPTRRPMRGAVRASARRAAGSACGWFRPTRSS
jgi:acetate kinase